MSWPVFVDGLTGQQGMPPEQIATGKRGSAEISLLLSVPEVFFCSLRHFLTFHVLVFHPYNRATNNSSKQCKICNDYLICNE